MTSKLKPLVYSPALPPVPAKALEKIRANAYFDLKELLPDNAALLQRLQELGHITTLTTQPNATVRLREINNPLTWIFCFLSFIAAKTDVEETRDLIAYAQIILQLARRHGGAGWLMYDQQFRQQAAGGALTPWREINNSLLSATVLTAQADAGAATRRLFCTQCQGDDHMSAECALGGSTSKNHWARPLQVFHPTGNLGGDMQAQVTFAIISTTTPVWPTHANVTTCVCYVLTQAMEQGSVARSQRERRKLEHHQMIPDHFQRVPGIPLRAKRIGQATRQGCCISEPSGTLLKHLILAALLHYCLHTDMV